MTMNNPISQLPILYSLRNCPYALRARIGIFKARQQVILRDVLLSDKPKEMVLASPKGTVPILVFEQAPVIEQSLDIMLWALNQSDPDDLLHANNSKALPEMLTLISTFDEQFKTRLEEYKCAKRYHGDTIIESREACEPFLQDLERRLTQHRYIFSDKESLTDLAILPFIRQFARVERQWYLQAPYPKLRQWLNNYLQSSMFSKVMTKHPIWLETKEVVVFGNDK